MRAATVIVLLLAACATARGGDDSSARFVYLDAGAIRLRHTAPGGEWSVNIRTATCERCQAGDQSVWWGTETKSPANVIDEIRVLLGSQSVAIPRSAFADLANVRRASMQSSGKEVRVTIQGGGSSTAYSAVLVFKDGALRERKVSSDTFPDNLTETTSYRREWPSDM